MTASQFQPHLYEFPTESEFETSFFSGSVKVTVGSGVRKTGFYS